MKIIKLNQGFEATVDDEDFEKLSKFKWYIGENKKWGVYAIRNVWNKGKNTTVRMHRQIMGLVNNDGIIVDHIDGNTLNNQKENLRTVTHQENVIGARKKTIGASKYKGVTWRKDRQQWTVLIRTNGTAKRLGNFKTEIEAALAYNKAALERFGQFAYLNVIES